MSMCSLGDIARECREICKDPTGLPVVGLEHLEPEDIELTRWDMPEETTFTKFFRKGQVLFGRRRSYLKKAAVAPCDGICSGDITVIEAIPGKVNPDLLPFIIQNDRFFTYANKGSAGSLSPRVKWAYLKDYPVNLPSLEEQARLAETFRALDKARRAYAHLIQTSDDLVKSQFVEMFGDSSKFNQEPLRLNIHEMFIGPFGSSLKNSSFVSKENGYCIVYEQKHAIQKTMNLETRYVDKKKYEELKRFNVQPGDIIVSCRGTVGEIFIIPEDAPLGIMHPSIMKIRLNLEKYNKVFFSFLLNQYMCQNKDKTVGTSVKMAVSAKVLGETLFIIPSISLQNQFEEFVEKIDKSKFEAQQALDRLKKLQKALYKKCFE